jgi:rubredoxin
MQDDLTFECPVCKTIHDGDSFVDPCPYCDWVYDYSEEENENEKTSANSVSLAEARRLFAKGLNQWGDPLPPKPKEKEVE